MTIKDMIDKAFIEAAIGNLIDKKHRLDESFTNGEINYAEYEEHKFYIQNDLDSLSCNIDNI